MGTLEEIHLNSHIHRVVEALKKEDRSFSVTELENQTGVKIAVNLRLLESLKNNPRIECSGETLRFVPIYNIRSVEDLRGVLASVNQKEGIEKAKLCESPLNVATFIDEIVRRGEAIVLKDMDGSEIVFYNDMKINPADKRVCELWDAVKVPNFHDLLEELNAAGMQKGDTIALKKRKVVKKKANKRQRMRIKVTNTHVKGLNLQGIDDSD